MLSLGLRLCLLDLMGMLALHVILDESLFDGTQLPEVYPGPPTVPMEIYLEPAPMPVSRDYGPDTPRKYDPGPASLLGWGHYEHSLNFSGPC